MLFSTFLTRVQNNYCSVTNYNDPNSWNYESWNTWATTKAPKKDVKLYIGAPGAPGGANPGSYVDAATLGKIATETRAKYPANFGMSYVLRRLGHV